MAEWPAEVQPGREADFGSLQFQTWSEVSGCLQRCGTHLWTELGLQPEREMGPFGAESGPSSVGSAESRFRSEISPCCLPVSLQPLVFVVPVSLAAFPAAAYLFVVVGQVFAAVARDSSVVLFAFVPPSAVEAAYEPLRVAAAAAGQTLEAVTQAELTSLCFCLPLAVFVPEWTPVLDHLLDSSASLRLAFEATVCSS